MQHPSWINRLIALAIIGVAVATIWLAVSRGVLVLPWMDETVGSKVSAADEPTIVARPDRYRDELFKNRWVYKIPIEHASFGTLLLQQTRFSIEGEGDIGDRTIVAQTAPAVKLVNGATSDRAAAFLGGFQRVLAQRKAYITHLSLSNSQAGYLANFVSLYVELGDFNLVADDLQLQRRLVRQLYALMKETDDSWAWFQINASRISVGPELSTTVAKILRKPATVKPDRQFFVAYVLRHEIEHAVSAYEIHEGDAHLSWMEEAAADVLARWPGEAAKTARELGFAIPKGADTQSVDTVLRRALKSRFGGVSGYDERVKTFRGLVGLAGIDASKPDQFKRADRLVQRGSLAKLSMRLADAIATHQSLSGKHRPWLARRITALDGSFAQFTALKRAIHKRALRT